MKNRLFFTLFFLVAVLVGCDELFEEDLTIHEVVLMSPADSTESINANQNFKWESIEGADSYNIRIVSPNFEHPEMYVLDSNTTNTNYHFQLDPGEYQWGVKAFNYSSETLYSINSIFVDSSAVFSSKNVGLVSPFYSYFNRNEMSFSWDEIDDADNYKFEIRNEEWETGSLFYSNETIGNLIVANLDEGNFYWGVKAYDQETQTETRYSTRRIVIDRTKPNRPILLAPEDKYITTESSLVLSWKRGDNFGSPLFDSIYISMKNDFTAIILRAATTDTVYEVQPGLGTYFWRVQSFDKAGNSGDNSIYRQFDLE